MKMKKVNNGWLILLTCLFMGAATLVNAQAVGVFEGHSDVGVDVKPGNATYDAKTQRYEVAGAGYNIWGDHDEFHFLWKKMKGDFLVYARGEFVGKGVELHRKFGWMARASLDGKAAHVNAVVHGDGLTSLQFRKTAGAATSEIKAKMTYADVIQLERKGNTYTMRVAKFGEPFITEQVTDVDLGEEVYVGVFVGSHNKDIIEKAIFKDVRIVIPQRVAEPSNVMKLASHIEILDVETGSREIVFTAPNSIQAPNFTADGKTLLYNGGGLIYTLDLATRTSKVLNTGDVKNNNNDHVISFNGKMLGLSSGVKELGGSIIYTVPIKGGVPKQITPKGPSYLHGWSPDGKTLVFCGARDGVYDIYSIPAKGGPEVRLTKGEGRNDGPEYTPDGKYIYFNSTRTGTMQIWRMKPDGSEQEAVTNGEFQDWFPHISPDGKWIQYISYLKEEVEAIQHPPYKHVYLQLMPITGGKSKVIAYLYGGQGTINTPAWSPDGKKIAFVSNTELDAK
jgi:TolB protein